MCPALPSSRRTGRGDRTSTLHKQALGRGGPGQPGSLRTPPHRTSALRNRLRGSRPERGLALVHTPCPPSAGEGGRLRDRTPGGTVLRKGQAGQGPWPTAIAPGGRPISSSPSWEPGKLGGGAPPQSALPGRRKRSCPSEIPVPVMGWRCCRLMPWWRHLAVRRGVTP